MKILKSIFDFYIKASIHVAVAVFSLVQITKIALNITTAANLSYVVFFGTIIGYNFLKYGNLFAIKKYTFKNKTAIFITSLLASFGMIFYFLQLSNEVKLALCQIGILVLLYPFFRKYGIFKMFIVAFCITFITVYVIAIQDKTQTIYVLQRFFIVICLLIPLEIVDLEIDAKSLITLPQIIGTKKTKLFGYFLLLNCFLLDLFYAELKINVIINTFILSVIALFIFFSNSNKSKYFTSFWVESIPILWWLLLLIFS